MRPNNQITQKALNLLLVLMLLIFSTQASAVTENECRKRIITSMENAAQLGQDEEKWGKIAANDCLKELAIQNSSHQSEGKGFGSFFGIGILALIIGFLIWINLPGIARIFGYKDPFEKLAEDLRKEHEREKQDELERQKRKISRIDESIKDLIKNGNLTQVTYQYIAKNSNGEFDDKDVRDYLDSNQLECKNYSGITKDLIEPKDFDFKKTQTKKDAMTLRENNQISPKIQGEQEIDAILSRLYDGCDNIESEPEEDEGPVTARIRDLNSESYQDYLIETMGIVKDEITRCYTTQIPSGNERQFEHLTEALKYANIVDIWLYTRFVFFDERYSDLEYAYLVSHVEPGSPADRSGILPGDMIFCYGGVPITNSKELNCQIISHLKAPTTIEIYREGNIQRFMIDGGDVGVCGHFQDIGEEIGNERRKINEAIDLPLLDDDSKITLDLFHKIY